MDIDRWYAYLDGELSPEEKHSVEEVLASNEDKRISFERIRTQYEQILEYVAPLRELNLWDVEAHWQRLRLQLNHKVRASVLKK